MPSGKNCTIKLKTLGAQCWAYEELLPELCDNLGWCAKCIWIILKSSGFDLQRFI